MAKLNCWEFKKCGRQPGGDKEKTLGECPATRCFKAHSLNDGINGGRACWAIAGTFCGGEEQGSFTDKAKGCVACEFFNKVLEEEGGSLSSVPEILKQIKDEG